MKNSKKYWALYVRLSHDDGDKTESLSISNQKLKLLRSEERRVGKECRSRWSPYH